MNRARTIDQTACSSISVMFKGLLMHSEDCPEPPDPEMSPEQQAVADTLSQDFVEKIDQALLRNCSTRNRKVARVIGTAMSEPFLRIPGLPDLFYAQRIKRLVNEGKLVADGNLDYMRYSEVRLP